jgi:hypothetical protein
MVINTATSILNSKQNVNYKMFNAEYRSSSYLSFFSKNIFLSFFILVAMATRVLHGIQIFEQFFKGDHQRNIPMKFDRNWFSGL